jgi:hypothetical protein
VLIIDAVDVVYFLAIQAINSARVIGAVQHEDVYGKTVIK